MRQFQSFSMSADLGTEICAKEVRNKLTCKHLAKNFILKKSSPTGKNRLNTMGRSGRALCRRQQRAYSSTWTLRGHGQMGVVMHAPTASTADTHVCPFVPIVQALWVSIHVHTPPQNGHPLNIPGHPRYACCGYTILGVMGIHVTGIMDPRKPVTWA